jgi:hypothetical protein
MQLIGCACGDIMGFLAALGTAHWSPTGNRTMSIALAGIAPNWRNNIGQDTNGDVLEEHPVWNTVAAFYRNTHTAYRS